MIWKQQCIQCELRDSTGMPAMTNQRFPGCHVLEAMIAAVGCVIQHNVKYPGLQGRAISYRSTIESHTSGMCGWSL